MEKVRAPGRRRADLSLVATCLLGLSSVLLCWAGVGWAFQRGGSLILDELGNLPWPRGTAYSAWFHILPTLLYNDRPLGSMLEFFLYRTFGFDYSSQLACFLLFHFANCLLVYLLFRRVGLRPALCLGCVAVFGCLSTTAQTATYLGASFDVLCTFFLLGSTVVILGKTRSAFWVSALLYFLALRTKEFAIVLPVFLTVLLVGRTPHAGGGLQRMRAIWHRLWPHYAVFVVFSLWYLRLAAKASIPAGNPYHVDSRVGTILRSLSYYTALIFGREAESPIWWPAAVFAAIFVYGLLRRRPGIVFAGVAFLLTMAPTCVLPGMRSPFYVYCPGIFLILEGGLFLEDLLATVFRNDAMRRRAALVGAALLMSFACLIRFGPYFEARAAYARNVRGIAGKTAASAQRQLGGIGPSSRVYLNHGAETPFLMIAGPCYFLRLIRHDASIACIMGMPYEELRLLYDGDSSEKYFVDYRPDGSLTVRFSARPGPGGKV